MKNPGIAVAIPARYESKRLPGKLLLDETGKYLLQHVYEHARDCERVDSVYIATNSDQIESAAESFGATVLRTGEHPSGTDRLSEAVREMDEDIILNIQGDEPEVTCDEIHPLADLMCSGRWDMGTLCTPITDRSVLKRPSCVKVVLNQNGRALYFSRAPIPWDRTEFDGSLLEPEPSFSQSNPLDPDDSPWKLHVGMYGFTRETLNQWTELPRGPLEQREELEQLRALENGLDIGVVEIPEAPIGIDTQSEYDEFVQRQQL